jgi:hypothetical protein
MIHRYVVSVATWVLIASCASNPDGRTLGGLRNVPPDVAEVDVDDSLDRAMQAYRQYLDETPRSTMTPEAMRRLADLQIEKQYGIIGNDRIVELPAPPESAFVASGAPPHEPGSAAPGGIADLTESEQDFEARATEQHRFSAATADDLELPDGVADTSRAGPVEAIRIYQQILTE